MNLLIDDLPHSIYIKDKEYAINWGFRTAILYEMMMLDNEVLAEEKPLLALRLFYPTIPDDWQEALEGIQWFYRCGEEERGKRKKRGRNTNQDRIYSFDYDAPYIYSAFLGQYGIDLNEVDRLHWWKFKALFQGLNEDCAISKIMGYRAVDINSVGKEQMDFYKKMKEQYAIPISKTEQEKQEALEQALMGDGKLKGIL
ncbi:bacteriophage Gp15 family protein [Anaerotignum sp.]|uniref:bacteriophage Gp15 family protein n=1 Tax=Anaerotignum sp. TaxID=2039241 RepID=UPI002714C585|nr:bacteriophage Gp15 family protein [Anaerotignum sp.]